MILSNCLFQHGKICAMYILLTIAPNILYQKFNIFPSKNHFSIHDCQHIRVDYVFQYHVLHLMCDVFSYRFGSILLSLFCNEPLLILFYFYSVGSFFFTCALVKDLKNDIESYNKIMCNKKIPESEKLTQLCERIRFSYLKQWVVMIDECWNYENRVFGRRFTISHFLSPFASSPLSRLLDQFVELYQTTLTLLFLGCTGAICLAMLMTQQQIVHVFKQFT